MANPIRAASGGTSTEHVDRARAAAVASGDPAPGAAPADRYAVVGNPIAHSRSPAIHAMFAAQTGERVEYGRLLAPLDGFVDCVARFREEGGRGVNVTVPFKLEAFALADRRTPRAEAAGAVNTLAFGPDGILGDNTDGAGLLRDLSCRLGLRLAGARVLLLGAGGAARGVVRPLLDAGVRALRVANRTPGKAGELAARFGDARLSWSGLGDVPAGFDLVINATASGLDDAAPAVPRNVLAGAALCHDMVYGARPTAFMRAALEAGCPRVADGLGMLVEQAAESFLLWRGVRPDTDAVHAALRAALDAEAAR